MTYAIVEEVTKKCEGIYVGKVKSRSKSRIPTSNEILNHWLHQAEKEAAQANVKHKRDAFERGARARVVNAALHHQPLSRIPIEDVEDNDISIEHNESKANHKESNGTI